MAVCRREGRGLFDLGDQFHGRDETVPAAWKRLNVPGLVRIVSERGTELLDAVIHTLFVVYKNIRAPELLVYFLPRDQLARARNQQPQHFQRLGSQPDGTLRFAQLESGRIEIEETEPKLPVVGQASPVSIASVRKQTSVYLAHPEVQDPSQQELTRSPATSWKSQPATIAPSAAVH